MAIRLRTVEGVLIACCAAKTVEKPGDVYLDDAQHYALMDKFRDDWSDMCPGLHDPAAIDPEHQDASARLRTREESNNPNAHIWNRTFGLGFGPFTRPTSYKVRISKTDPDSWVTVTPTTDIPTNLDRLWDTTVHAEWPIEILDATPVPYFNAGG